MGQKIAIFLLSSLYLFDSTFLFWHYYSGIVWIDKLHNCVPTWFVVYLENWEKILSHFSWERLQRGKIASSITLSYRVELPLKKLSWLDEVLSEKKCCNLKKLYLAKKGPMFKKTFSLKFLDYLSNVWKGDSVFSFRKVVPYVRT